MSRRLWRPLLVQFPLIVAALLMLAPPAIAKKRPDLVLVTSYLTGSKHFAYAGDTAEVQVFDVTKNTGKAAAGPSKNELTIYKGGAKFHDITRKVGRLQPGDKSSGTSTAKIDIPSSAGLGEYRAQLCVDARDEVKEEDEADNCDNLGPFYISKKTWTGTLGGTDDTSYSEQWNANGVTFASPKYIGDGHFDYALAQTNISYQASGSYNDCTYTGAGVDSSPPGILSLFYGAIGASPYYVASVNDKNGWSYPIQVNCKGNVTSSSGPATPNPLYTNAKPLPFGHPTLAGTLSLGSRDYVWNIH